MFATTLLTVAPAAGRPAAAVHSLSPWVAPVTGPIRVVRPFAPPPADQPWLAGHRGVDLAADPGQVIVSAGPGTVTFAGPVAGRQVVVVTHGPLRTTYEPVEPSVTIGDPVSTGSPIGRLEASWPAPDAGPAQGAAHCATPCLHWGLLRGDTYLNPMDLLQPPRIRLLPQSADSRLRSRTGPGFAPEPSIGAASADQPAGSTAPAPPPAAAVRKVRAASDPIRPSGPFGPAVLPDHAGEAVALTAAALASVIPIGRARSRRRRRGWK
jgi:Peptidase family M23